MKKLPFSRRLGFALAGLRDGWRRERSFRTQAFLGMFAVLVIVTLGAPAIWCAVVALAIALVLTAELLNSALETLTDRLHPEAHPEIRVVKDMAAASVLLVCVGALIVGLLLLFSVK